MITDVVRIPPDISQTQVTALTDTGPHSMRHSKWIVPASWDGHRKRLLWQREISNICGQKLRKNTAKNPPKWWSSPL